MLGTAEDLSLTVGKYILHIHSWLPFISRTRLQQQCARRSFQNQADMLLLLLAIKLITTPPPAKPRNPRTPLYQTVKHLYVEVEGSCALTLSTLQAGIIVALYELAHGIFPAAFLSVAGCARFAHAIGISVDRAVGTRKPLTLVETEERNRAWWAIVILDRSVPRPFVIIRRRSLTINAASSRSAVPVVPWPRQIQRCMTSYPHMKISGTRE